jgi:hypothetical protein
MDVKEKFLKLTQRTYPHGTEQDLFHLLPQNLETDEFGNKYLQIGEKPSTMFTSHLDTASSQVDQVVHEIDGNFITTNGKTILGADDKAGVTILLYMIEKNVPGLYYFFLGEERGCVGSRKVASKHQKEPIPYINKVVSFDRRGHDSVITHQLGGRCCSDSFGNALAEELNKQNETFYYSNDPTGIYTDSAQFINIYQECTNISVGYNYEHSHSEQQDIVHLEKLANAVVNINWESLPVDRKVTDIEEYDEFDDYYYPAYKKNDDKQKINGNKSNSWTVDYYFVDTEFERERSCVSFNKYTNSMTGIDLCDDRIQYETNLIQDLLQTLDVDYSTLEWDGFELVVDYDNGNVTTTSRTEMAEYIKELDFWKELIKIK